MTNFSSIEKKEEKVKQMQPPQQPLKPPPLIEINRPSVQNMSVNNSMNASTVSKEVGFKYTISSFVFIYCFHLKLEL